MALPPREVRYRKGAIYPILGFLVLMATIPFVMLFASPIFMTWSIILSFAVTLLLLFFIGRMLYQRLTSPEPVMTFYSDKLILHRKKNKGIYWTAITDWKIRSNKSNYYLVIRTNEGRTRVELNLLDHSSKDIRWLMETYIQQPGPGRVRSMI